MSSIRSCAIFLGSRDGINPLFGRKIADLCEVFARRNISIIYGGGNVGLMGLLANTAIDNGVHVTGVIPRQLVERELAAEKIQDLRIVESMHERKAVMTQLADAFMVLPGGIGTLDEFFEAYTWHQLGLHTSPIGLLNSSDFFDPLKTMLLSMVRDGFLNRETFNTLIFEADAERILDRMEAQIEAHKQSDF